MTRSTTRTIDVWTLNFGPEELMQPYLFEKGQVTDIRSVGNGSMQDLTLDKCRNGALLAGG